MFFRPAFCCNCGERIVREEWRLWTSRRFCALCATEHQGVDLIPKVVAAAGVLSIVFEAATFIKKPDPRESENTFTIKQTKVNLKPTTLYPSNTIPPVVSGMSAPENANARTELLTQQSEQPQRENRTSDEPVYYCGAITKKGTPCTRRVKTKGFCWQHAKSGQIAPARF